MSNGPTVPVPSESEVILIVADHPSTTKALHGYLCDLNYLCLEAHTVDAAWDHLLDGHIELLICDIGAETDSHVDLVAQAIEQFSDLAVLVVTDIDDPALASRAIDLGAYGYAVRPFQMGEIRTQVANALRRRELEIGHRTFASILEDRTAELAAIAEELSTREARFRSLASSSPMGILYGDEGGRCEYANARARELLGRTFPQLSGLQWLEYLSDVDSAQVEAAIISTLDGVDRATSECRINRSDGTVRWIAIHLAAVISEGGASNGFVAVVEDIEERRVLEQGLRLQATHDYLTGLPNRRLIDDQLSESILSLTDGGALGLLAVDVDQFKLVNDTYGHAVGDEVLVEVARRLESSDESVAFVGRLGGDEFVAVVNCEAGAELHNLAVRIRDVIGGSVRVVEAEVALTVSVGVAAAIDPNISSETLLQNADVALQRAKAAGRNGVAMFDDALRRVVSRQRSVGKELRHAIEAKQLSVNYQPQYGARTERLLGLEALARWTHKDWGAVSPDEFIPISETSGLVHLIDGFVLDSACGQLADWQRLGWAARACRMSVNLSAKTLGNGDTVRIVKAAVAKAGIDPSSLCLEITEGTAMADVGRSIDMLQQLRSLGVLIAVDDFGTGYSSLAYLRELPVDIVKIDRSFISRLDPSGDVNRPSRDLRMVAAIIDLAHHFELTVVAEGVEHAGQMDILRSLGCDEVQGYLFARPLAIDDTRIESLLDSAGRIEPAAARSVDIGR